MEMKQPRFTWSFFMLNVFIEMLKVSIKYDTSGLYLYISQSS